jgi:hypothetical protein
MKKPLLISLLGFLFLLASTAAYSQKIETIDGVRVVHNVKGGQWGKNPQVTIKLFQTIGDLNTEDENLAFNSPSDIAMDSAGNIYVLDTSNQRIQKFSPAGKYLATIGRKGQGPGEFSYPAALDIDGQGNLYVLDPFVKKIHVLSPRGKEEKAIRMLKDTIFRTRLSRTGQLVASIFPRFEAESEQQTKESGLPNMLRLCDSEGQVIHEFAPIFDYGDSISNTLGNLVQFDVDKNDAVYVSFLYQNRLEKYSSDARQLWKADRPLNYGTGIIEKGKRESRGVSGPRMNSVSAGIAADDQGRTWVATLNRQIKKEEQVSTIVVAGAKSRTLGNRDLQKTDIYKLEIFGPDGVLLGEIPLEQFVDYIRIMKDSLFLIDAARGAKIYQYKIIEK